MQTLQESTVAPTSPEETVTEDAHDNAPICFAIVFLGTCAMLGGSVIWLLLR